MDDSPANPHTSHKPFSRFSTAWLSQRGEGCPFGVPENANPKTEIRLCPFGFSLKLPSNKGCFHVFPEIHLEKLHHFCVTRCPFGVLLVSEIHLEKLDEQIRPGWTSWLRASRTSRCISPSKLRESCPAPSARCWWRAARALEQGVVRCWRRSVEKFRTEQGVIWVWVKIKATGDRRFWCMFPLPKVPFWVPICDPQPSHF